MASPISTSNSLATRAEANTYFSNSYHRATIWDDMDDDYKAQLLIESTSILINYLDWIIPFPEEDYSEANTVHKMACFEQAWANYNADRQAEAETKGISEIKVDVIELKFDKSDRPRVIPDQVTHILRDYISGSPNSLNVPTARA